MANRIFDTAVEPTIDNENFRAQIKALQYEVDSLKQQREYTELQHEKVLREAVLRANEDSRKSQVCRGFAIQGCFWIMLISM